MNTQYIITLGSKEYYLFWIASLAPILHPVPLPPARMCFDEK
jgi:hypothetical protein